MKFDHASIRGQRIRYAVRPGDPARAPLLILNGIGANIELLAPFIDALTVPTIVTVYLDRPAILTPLKERARAVIANFGVSDAALLDVVTGLASPEGKLPFELPSSMEAVAAQKPDVPHDSKAPLYKFGFGLRY